MNSHGLNFNRDEKLERRRELINHRLDIQRQVINDRFDRKQAQINGKLNARQEQIIAAALALLSKHGLNDLSLRDIARELHLQAPALYWHFRSKEMLVDFMAEAILHKEFPEFEPRAENETWQVWLTNHMLRLRDAMLAYPDGARIVAGAHLYPAVTLAKLSECALASLISAGVDLRTALNTVTTAANYTFGFVIEEQAGPTAAQVTEFTSNTFLLESYPNLVKAMKMPRTFDGDIKDVYLIGLGYIIKGSQA